VRRTIAILAGTAIAASTVAVAAPANAAETIPGGGASFPYVFLSQCLSDFNASQNNFDIEYTSTGSGTGKGNFTKGTFVYAQTDSKFSSGTEPSFGWEYIPNIGGAIVFPINLKNSKTGRSLGSSIQLKQKTLAKIMGGQITNWRDREILNANPRIAAGIPNKDITVVYRSDKSGTTNNLLQYLNSWAPSIFAEVQDTMSTAFPGGKPPSNSVSGNKNSGVMAQILAKDGAIGYVDLGDAKGYPAARVENALGEFVAPSSSSAARNLANQTDVQSSGLVDLNYKVRAKGAYPIAIFSYALARTDGKGANGLGVRQFVDYTIQKCGPSRAAALGFVPVGGKVLAKAKQLVRQIK
jgi:phosphate transport system substrate-binding protein